MNWRPPKTRPRGRLSKRWAKVINKAMNRSEYVKAVDRKKLKKNKSKIPQYEEFC